MNKAHILIILAVLVLLGVLLQPVSELTGIFLQFYKVTDSGSNTKEVKQVLQATGSSTGTSDSGFTFDQAKFTSEGLPSPTTPATLDPQALQLWKQYFMDDAVKAANAVGIDIGWVGFWAFYEGINYNTTFNNCNESAERWNPNMQCYSNSWQVGPAVRPYDLGTSELRNAFDTMYGDHEPDTIRRVGQQVIDNMKARHNVQITYPSSTFPEITIDELIAQNTDANRHWFVHLTRDDAIGMYYIAKTFKGHVDAADQMAQRMCGWGACGPGDHYDPQRTINFIKAVYDAGISGTPGSGSVGGGSFEIKLYVKVRPGFNDTWLLNRVEAVGVGGGEGEGGGTPGGSNGPVNPDATCPGVGPITCGTKQGSSVAGACHCTASYQASACSFSGGVCSYCAAGVDSASYAIDITNPLDGPVYVPKVSINGEAHTVTCEGYGNEAGSVEPGQVIQILSCSDDETDEAIWMQFHHSKKENPLTPGATYKTGDAIGRSASFQVFNSGPHVHFQIGIGGPCGFAGTQGCVPADQYVQCN